MNTRWFLIVVGLTMLFAGCNRYSYPPKATLTASSANQNLIASLSAPNAAGSARLDVVDMSCQGSDHVINVHYDQGFDAVQFLDLQYQVVPKSSNGTRVFTQSTGTLAVQPPTASGDLALTIPGEQIPGKDSDVLLRLKLKTLTVVEYISPQEQIHISETCR